MPTLCEPFQDYMSSKSYRSAKTSDAYRRAIDSGADSYTASRRHELYDHAPAGAAQGALRKQRRCIGPAPSRP